MQNFLWLVEVSQLALIDYELHLCLELNKNMMFENEIRTTKSAEGSGKMFIFKLSACRNQENSLAVLPVKTLPAISIT
jgi:hypothetical protein